MTLNSDLFNAAQKGIIGVMFSFTSLGLTVACFDISNQKLIAGEANSHDFEKWGALREILRL